MLALRDMQEAAITPLTALGWLGDVWLTGLTIVAVVLAYLVIETGVKERRAARREQREIDELERKLTMDDRCETCQKIKDCCGNCGCQR